MDLRAGARRGRLARRPLLRPRGWASGAVAASLRRRARLWLVRLALVGLLAVTGSLVGLRLAGPTARETALGTVSVRVGPSWHGQVDAFIPIANWGVRADAFSGPLTLHVEPRSVDREALLRAAGGERSVLSDAERDARRVAHRALLRALAWAVGGALAFGLAAVLAARTLGRRSLGRSVAWLLAPPACAALLAAVVLVRVQHTFDPGAFRTPRFYAQGAELGQLLKVAGKAQTTGERYRSSVHRTLAGYATLLNAGVNLAPVEAEAPAVLISDLHGNQLVVGPLRRLFTGRPVFFAGDFGQRGSPAEASALIPQLTALGGPLVAVSGNHDSRLFMRRLAAAGAVVLTEHGRLRRNGRTDGRPVQRVGGLRVAGYADPLEWRGDDPDDPRRIFSFGERPDGDRDYARVQEQLLRWFQRLPRRPHVVLVHQNGLAQGLAEALSADGDTRPLLILTGHDHEQHVDRYGEILVVDAGTVGAGGAFGVGAESVGVAHLHFPEEQTRPRAIDLVQVEPLSGAASAERIVPSTPEACDRDRVNCHDEE
jgi:predicted phosphodiesterase